MKARLFAPWFVEKLRVHDVRTDHSCDTIWSEENDRAARECKIINRNSIKTYLILEIYINKASNST